MPPGWSSKIGSQLIRSSEAAACTLFSPQYIQYFPFSLVATSAEPTKRQTMAPDLVHARPNSPPNAFLNAGPCFVHESKSGDVAMQSRAVPSYDVYVMTYPPSSVCTTRGSSSPPCHSMASFTSWSGNRIGSGRRPASNSTPSCETASPKRLVPAKLPTVSSARYIRCTFPSLTTADGLNTSFSSHLMERPCIGHKNVVSRRGSSTGFSCSIRMKGPN
mmetsp:Transcript_17382/g.31680  ORF Transcript_17382/g.31680 Transcript_17382/m.31680 type:complete len:218 (+) Transcript_17382:596-1249(+)